MSKTTIAWTEQTWNPVRGCSRVSPGCQNCYAERMAARFSGGGETDQSGEVVMSADPFFGFANNTPSGPRWTGKVELIESMLDIPLRRRKPTTWFVNSMSDLFHESLPDEAIDRVFAVMALCPQHQFQVLTKRAERMWEYGSDTAMHGFGLGNDVILRIAGRLNKAPTEIRRKWPLPNVRLGISVEDQQRADERFPFICELGEAGWNTMVSFEPLIGPVIVPERYLALGMRAWPVIGGESGPGSKPCNIAWIRSLVGQCKAAGVRCFVKQAGASIVGDPGEFPTAIHDDGDGHRTFRLQDRKGGDPSEWPEWMKVRELP